MAAARRAQAPLRRRGRRSRLARARDRVLPREAARHPRRLRARQVVHRLRRRGAEHDDHPLQLPHSRRRRVLPRERAPVRAPLGRARLQPHVLPARPPHARALGPGAGDDAGAGRGEQAARDQVERGRPAGDPRALPTARRLGSPFLSDPRAPSITLRAGSSATTPSSGVTRGLPTSSGSRSTRTRRSRASSAKATASSRSRRRAAASSADRSSARPPAGRPSSPGSRACASRSRRTSSRPSSPSR